MDINEYFRNKDYANAKLSSSLPQGPLYSKTIKDFYEDLIGPRLDEIDVKILKEWNDMLERYINLETPIYWIRKYDPIKQPGTCIVSPLQWYDRISHAKVADSEMLFYIIIH